MVEGSEDESEDEQGYQEGMTLPEAAQEVLQQNLLDLEAEEATAEPQEAAVAVPAEALEPPVMLFDELDVSFTPPQLAMATPCRLISCRVDTC